MSHLCKYLALLCSLVPLLALADDAPIQVKDVEVTAEKREAVLSKAAESITVIERGDLESGLIQDVRDASFYVPNLYMNGFSARHTAFPFIRGLGGSGQGEPAVTTYLDGVPQLTFNSADMELLGLQRIEVARGPQGTLYGRNTLGGAIHLITRRPAHEFGIETGVGFGSDDLQHYRLRLDVPLAKDLAYLSVEGSYFERDGYTRNDITGKDVDQRRSTSGRAQLLLTPTDELEILISLFAESDRDGDFVLAPITQLQARPYHITHDFDGYNDRNIITPSMVLRLFGDGVDFVSVTSFEHVDNETFTDTDFTIEDGLRRQVSEDHDAWYQEFRLQSPDEAPFTMGESMTLQWLTGISFSYSQFSHDEINEGRPSSSFNPFPVSLFSVQSYELEDWAMGVFGQGTLTIDDKLDLTLGLRYQAEQKEWDINFAYPGPVTRTDNDNESFDQWLPKAGIAYRWNETFMTYASAAKGYRSGGYNRNVGATKPLTYDEETSWSYEAGFKSMWFDRRLMLNVAVFYIDWDDMQLNLANTDPSAFATTYIDNAGSARSQGIELELAARLTERFTWYAGYGLADAEFTDYVDPGTGTDYSGNDVPTVPAYNWHTGIEYRQALAEERELYGRLDVVGFGDIAYDASNAAGEGPVALTNLRVGYTWKSWTLEGWVHNLFDHQYIPLAFDFTGTGFYVGRNGEPRTLGVTLSTTF